MKLQACTAALWCLRWKKSNDRSRLAVVAFAQALTNTMPWRGIQHKGSSTGCYMAVWKKLPQHCLLTHSLTYQRASPQIWSGRKQQSFPKLKQFWARDPGFGSTQLIIVIITGEKNWCRESVGWRVTSRSTLNSFRQNIKVLQQLLRVQRLKSEQRQAHRELLLLPGREILFGAPVLTMHYHYDPHGMDIL